jgi:hypothetical protein
MYGQLNFATMLGVMFQNAMMPLGVEGGTRSRAAERMITYRTTNSSKSFLACAHDRPLTVIDKTKQKEGETEAEEIPSLF